MAGKVKFDGEAGSVELNRITAKKNYASSMQSHKMGATYAFDLILHKLAEEKYPDLANEVNGAVAVKQLPALTFQETLVEGSTDTYARDFIGNFTVGADKGDKGYFGFENEGVKDVGIRLEGTDHLKGVGFNYPWEVGGVKNIRYNADKEALCIVTGNDPSKWTAILEQSFVGNKKTEGDIEAFLEQEFRPAFECAYRANPLLVGTTLTLEAMNANIDSFGNQRRADGRLYSYCEVWRDGEYDLYYLNQERGQYEPNGVNLYNELSDEDRARVDSATTLDEKNEIFIANRIARFAEEAPSYFCIDDAIYQYTFLYMLVASDNFEKNMYPYKMGLLANDSRWRFFQDDLDSIGSTDNQAQDTKSYSAEVEDFTDESQSAYVFKGEDSALWQAIRMAFPDRIRRMGRDILQAMYDLSPTGTQTLEKLMGFFDEYFFSRAQGYFPPSAYNNDAEIAYEEAWNNKDYVASVDIHPLAQSLGDHNLAERQFWEKRMLYLMSKFGFGGYGSYEDKELGVISFRTQTAQSFTLTPAIDSYPTILGGASQISSSSERVKAGVPVTLPAVGGNNTNTYIAGADWLADIGDLKELKVDPSMVLALNVGSKRLQRLKVGDEDASAVTSTLEALAVQSCPSLTQVDARNLETLTGSVNLSRCPRLREAMFGGTNVTTVTIAAGSKIEHLQLPDSVTVLDLRNTKFLSNFELGDYTHIGFLRLENNKYIDGFSALKNAYADGGGSLQNVRIVGFNYAGDSTDADFLASLADGVYGIDSEGNPTIGKPVIEGTLNIDGSIYEDSAEAIRANYPNLTLIVEGGYYIRFADPVVKEICATNWGDGAGTGITKEQAAAIKNFNNKLQSNAAIVTFQEAKYFSGLTTLNGAFKSSSIQTLILDFEGNNANAIDISAICQACNSLVEVVIRNAKIKFGGNEFNNCDQLVTIRLENCDTSESTSLAYTLANTKAIESTDFLNGNDWRNVTNLGAFLRSSNVKRASFPATFSSELTSVAELAYGVPELEELDLSNLVWDNVTNYQHWVAPHITKLRKINVGQGMCKATQLVLPNLYWERVLERIDGWFDARSTTGSYKQDYGFDPCRRLEIRNIGMAEGLTSFSITTSTWGINSAEVPDAEESLIDSMHYLHDRVASGFETCTLILSAATKNVLNKYPDLVAEIVSKGYTIA